MHSNRLLVGTGASLWEHQEKENKRILLTSNQRMWIAARAIRDIWFSEQPWREPKGAGNRI
jgi:hypothetical protein